MNKRLLTVTYSCILVFCSVIHSPSAEASGVTVTHLRCEYSVNPLAIATTTPRFSWVLNSPERGMVQQAYQLLVASSTPNLTNDMGDIWDTGRVDSSQSTYVPFGGKSLQSNQLYYWKVRVWGSTGEVSGFSAPASFGTALLDPADWKAAWIGRGPEMEPRGPKGYYDSPPKESDSVDPIEHDGRSTLLRKEILVDRSVRRARIHVCGLGFYELTVNGSSVGNSVLMPAKTNYRKQVLYNTYDITDMLTQGTNALGIALGNGWFNPYKKWWSWRMQWYGSQRAIAQLHLEYSDGTSEITVTDETWKTSTGPVVRSCIYDGETYDANLEVPGWDTPGFDDSGWEKAHIVEPPGGNMIPHTMEPIQVTETIRPVNLTNPKPEVWIFDMGQNFAGWARLTVQGPAGTEVRMRYAENIGADGLLDRRSMNLAEATGAYILKGQGVEVYEPHFTYYGFRYVEVTGFPGKPTLDSLTGCVVHSACKPVGTFDCGNELINRIHRATLWSQRSNMIGYPMDCPQRDERLGWMGDAHVTAEEAMLNFHMPLFYANWLSGIQANQNQESGDLPYISPRPFDESGTIAWSSAYILIAWYGYLHYGDHTFLQDHFESMKKYVDFLGTEAEDFILPKDRYGDWLSVSENWQRGEPEGVSTAYYYYNASLVAKIADVLGEQDDSERYSSLAEKIKDRFNKRFLEPDRNQYEAGSQCSNAFPLFLDIVPDTHRKAVLDTLIENILVKEKGHLTTGLVGTKYMMEMLSQEGRSDIAYLLATQTSYPSWGNLIEGRTTLSEHWNQSGSNNHVMFGGVDTWFYRELAGMNTTQTKPGYEYIIIKPFVHPELGWAAASIDTERGVVSSRWELTGGVLHQKVTIPVNCSATVYVLAKDATGITEGGKAATEAEDVEFLRMDGNHAVFEIGSGTYHFQSNNASDLIQKPYTAAPQILPEETFVTVPNVVKLEMKCKTEGATIRYTLDGSEPTNSSEEYGKPFQLTESAEVKAKGFKQGYQPSVCAEKAYVFVDPEGNGLFYELFEGAFECLPDFSTLTPLTSGHIYSFGFEGVDAPELEFALKISGFLEIANGGEYCFYTVSNDGSRLFIDNSLVVDNDGGHTALEKSGTVSLTPGRHSIVVTYFQKGGGKELKALYEGPEVEKQEIPASRLFFR